MIALLEGTVAHATDSTVVVVAGAVGYLLHVADPQSFPTDEPCTVHTTMIVKEDALDLYGFVDTDQRDLFDLLRSAQGIGPKTALAALATLPASTLLAALAARDIDTLVSIPGIGTKSAQKMCLELADAAAGLAADESTVATATTRDAATALRSLGYLPTEIAAALRDVDTEDVSVAIRHALTALSNA